MTPLLDHSYNSSNEINDEIVDVCEKICSAAEQSLPLRKSSVEKKKWYKDQTLSRLASLKKAAWDRWSANGRPKEGPLYDAKINTRAEFRKRMRVCAANSERKRIQRFDTQFKQRSSNRFKRTHHHCVSTKNWLLTQKPSYWHGKITSDRLVLQIPTNLQQLCTAQSKRSMS